jgi:[acyl-carrier-protein] S-malonyltransferase
MLFPGQGSHADGMEEPYRNASLLRRGLAQLDYDPFARLAGGTRFQQPALFLCGVAAWEQAGRPDAAAAAGHSLGEYAALVAAGALEFDDALRLVDIRAAAMSDAGDASPGGMVALLGASPEAAEELAERHRLSVANDNAPGQIVLSGPRDAVQRAADDADDVGARARVLPVSGAFHSPAMRPAQDALRAALAEVEVTAPRFPVYSNGTAAPFEDVREQLAANLLAPVRFRESVLAMRADGVEEFDELGPGNVLAALVKRTLREAPA